MPKADQQQYWLVKSEPESRIEKGKDVKFSFDDLKVKQTSWEGVRNYEARNIMRDKMRVGDLVFFYHSNCKVPGIIGIARVCKEGYPDSSAFDPTSPYYDAKSNKESPKWFMVDIEYVKPLDRFMSLKELQSKNELQEMVLVKRGRLSVQPVTKKEFDFILKQSGTSL